MYEITEQQKLINNLSNGVLPKIFRHFQGDCLYSSMPPAGFEPAIPASEQPKTYALHRAANGVDDDKTNTKLYIPLSTEVTDINTSGRTIVLGSTQPLTN
jgi:hypothetical protein